VGRWVWVGTLAFRWILNFAIRVGKHYTLDCFAIMNHTVRLKVLSVFFLSYNTYTHMHTHLL